MIKAGCEFSVAQELLLLAPGEATAAYESGVGRTNAEGSVAQPGTRGRESQGSLARVLVLHGSCREHAFSPSCKQ